MSADKTIKIAIVGPESTGKSAMAVQLAEAFDTIYIPEFSREYCKGLNRNYTLEDEVNIFWGQLALEDEMIQQARNGIVFCDTMVLTVKIWSDYLFAGTPSNVLAALAEQHYDLYLLMDIDLPWEDDELRDFPNLREYFMEVWHKELKSISANYRVVSGLGEQRFKNAKQIVDEFLLKVKGDCYPNQTSLS
ncbi:AAA family ATPase [Albibacterium indicum]|uniref:AAA family ATPase n=1 Tax=Albibacterium indicum TaxID=2292082 RepID=UPI000E486B68|nr:ATP-binding protein [Pedobacter indicus]